MFWDNVFFVCAFVWMQMIVYAVGMFVLCVSKKLSDLQKYDIAMFQM